SGPKHHSQVKIGAALYSRPHSRQRRPCTWTIGASPFPVDALRAPRAAGRSFAAHPAGNGTSLSSSGTGPGASRRVPRGPRACPPAALDERVDEEIIRFPYPALMNAGTPRVSVCLPARNEAETIAAIVREAVGLDIVDEVVVLDDGSIDGTAAVARDAGARVVR